VTVESTDSATPSADNPDESRSGFEAGIRFAVINDLGWNKPGDEGYVDAATEIFLSLAVASSIRGSQLFALQARHLKAAAAAVRDMKKLKRPAAVARRARKAGAELRAHTALMLCIDPPLRAGWQEEDADLAIRELDRIFSATDERQEGWRAAIQDAVLVRELGRLSEIYEARVAGARKAMRKTRGNPRNLDLHFRILLLALLYQKQTGKRPTVSRYPAKDDHGGKFFEWAWANSQRWRDGVRCPPTRNALARAIERSLKNSGF